MKDHIELLEEAQEDDEVIEPTPGKRTPDSQQMSPPAPPVKATKVPP